MNTKQRYHIKSPDGRILRAGVTEAWDIAYKLHAEEARLTKNRMHKVGELVSDAVAKEWLDGEKRRGVEMARF